MADVGISHLRCEYLVEPRGLDERQPRLSWTMVSGRRGARQTAYRVCVARTLETLVVDGPDLLWDSGRVESTRTTHVEYAGTPLQSRDVCHWRVEVWDETGVRTLSEPASWTMGLLQPTDWSARWVAAPPEIIDRDPEAVAPTGLDPGTPALFRREIVVPGPILRATLYATARGVFELRTNGARIGHDVFAPEWTDYDSRIQYRTYDITSLLHDGTNVVAATLGDGWWSGYVGWQETRGRYGSLENSILMQVEIVVQDGQRITVGTDDSWQCETGPILSSDFMMGEVYDARRERRGWDQPGFAAHDWLPARVVAPPGVPLVAQRSEPVQVMEQITPVSIRSVQAGVIIADLGQNLAGRTRLRVNAPSGTRITLRHGERLNPDGTLYTENLRRAKATDVYIASGSGEEVFEPHFTFHGFQYVEVRGLPHTLTAADITGCVIRSTTPDAGRFACSNPDVTRLWLNGLWSQKDNFLSVPTDCPQRDERLGWMGDAQVFLRTASYNMDVAAFFTKWMIDIEDAQTPEGVFPDTAPRLREGENFVGLGNLGGSAGWADAGVIVPYTIWQVYGDRRIIARHYDAMVRWVDWIAAHNPDGVRRHHLANNYGDWLCVPSDTSFGTHSPMKYLLATAYWADDCSKLARIAHALGRTDDATRFGGMFEHIRAAFQREWVTPDGRVTADTQTGYLLALAFDLLPADRRDAAVRHLIEDIRTHDWHLTTGFIGISHLNPQLTLAGHHEIAGRLLLQDTYPSWLYPIRHGATTIWERWNGWTHEDGFFEPSMNSFNHYSLGSVGEWLFRHLAGIELDPDEPGYQRFVLRPFVCNGIETVDAAYRTMHGEIGSRWQHTGGTFTWTVTIPPNTTAAIDIPSTGGAAVFEGAVPIEQATGVRVLAHQHGRLRCDVSAGTFTFVSTLA